MLLDTGVFNTRMFDGGTSIANVYSTDTLVFDNFSLSDGTTVVLTDLRYLGPTRELVGGSIPRGDGGYLTADYFREYVIEAEGIVKQSTAALLDAYLDTMRKSLRRREANLDLTDANGTVKRFVATLDNYEELFAGRQRYHTTICPWKARFRCKTPFGKARSYTNLSLTLSSTTTSQSIVNAGTYKAPAVVILIFSAATSITGVSVQNTTTGETLTLTSPTVAANDVFIIDGELKSVTKNGTAHDFTGTFPFVDVGANVLTFTVTGTSFSASLTVKHKLTYL